MQFQIYLSVGSGLTLHLYKRKVTHSLWPFGEEDDCSYLQFNQAQMFYLCRSQVKRCSSIIVAHIHVMTKKLKVGYKEISFLFFWGGALGGQVIEKLSTLFPPCALQGQRGLQQQLRRRKMHRSMSSNVEKNLRRGERRWCHLETLPSLGEDLPGMSIQHFSFDSLLIFLPCKSYSSLRSGGTKTLILAVP